jgi:phage terminase large subunit-like protein
VSPPSTNSSNAAPVAVESWPPRWLTPVPAADVERGDGTDYCGFIEACCRVTKDSFAAPAGSLIKMRPWTKSLFGHLLARTSLKRYRHRQALIGMARKNVKSTSGAGLGLAGLVLGPFGGEVYSCAGDREQARIVFGTARRMVEMDPQLSERLKLYRDAIEFTRTGSVYKVLSAEAYTKEGLNPTLVVFDEVHVQPDRELWDVMALASGARVDPLMVGITTAGVRYDASGADSLCYSLYEYGKRVASGEVDDPAFFMAWWEPRDPTADHRDPNTWREANPGYGDFIDPEDFASSVLRTPENEFRTKRCNQWVTSTETFLPAGVWQDCTDSTRVIPDRAPVILGFDGSRSGDATAISVVSLEDVPHVDVVGLWEKPRDAHDWEVPRTEVKDTVRDACKRWDVKGIAWDEYLWLDAADELEAEGLPIVRFPQVPQRMSPATQRFYELAVDRALTHSGDAGLARHIGNAVLKVDSRGWRIYKEHKSSPRKIDLAVATVMAVWLAANLEVEETQPFFASWR